APLAPPPRAPPRAREPPPAPPPAPPTAPAEAPRVEAARPPSVAPPGFLVVSARPWGKLYVDDKLLGDVEGSRRFSLPSGIHEVRLTNGRRVKTWPQIEVKPGKSLALQHSFLDE